MNGYVPKVGDNVKAKLGESVNVGEVVDMTANNGNCVHIELGVESWAYCDLSDGWNFEQVVSVPTKFGAVIRRADGLISFLGDTFEEEGSRWWHPTLGWCTESHATAGGFTVLFDGVDE